MEFTDSAQLVHHINTQHIQARRGAEEYPCFWKVREKITEFVCQCITSWYYDL